MQKVLFLTKIDFLTSTNTGGKMIAKRNYEMMCSAYGKENVYVLCIGKDVVNREEQYKEGQLVPNNLCIDSEMPDIPAYINYLQGRFMYDKATEKRMVSYIETLAPDIIFLDGTWIGLVLKKCKFTKKPKLITYFHDIEANVQYKWAVSKGYSRPFRFFRYYCVKKNEEYLAKNSDALISMNKRDSDLLYKYYKATPDFYLPTTIIDSFNEEYLDTFYKQKLAEDDEPTLLCVGVYFPPTINGLDWVVNEIADKLNCKLIVVGRNMKQYKPPKSANNLIIVGEVDDLAKYYGEADAVICPIFIGDGMKTKTAEAMMYGKTLFATDEALEGYECEGVEGIFRCNTPNEFVGAINGYFAEAYKNKKYNASVRNLFLEKYEFEAKNKGFIEWLQAESLIEKNN